MLAAGQPPAPSQVAPPLPHLQALAELLVSATQLPAVALLQSLSEVQVCGVAQTPLATVLLTPHAVVLALPI